jgi:hypothetical protein
LTLLHPILMCRSHPDHILWDFVNSK